MQNEKWSVCVRAYYFAFSGYDILVEPYYKNALPIVGWDNLSTFVFGAVNACALPSRMSSGMLYRDTDGRYGEGGQIQMFNVYRIDGTPILRKLPTFWMVK